MKREPVIYAKNYKKCNSAFTFVFLHPFAQLPAPAFFLLVVEFQKKIKFSVCCEVIFNFKFENSCFQLACNLHLFIIKWE